MRSKSPNSTVSLNTNDLPPEHRLEAWHAYNAGLFELKHHEVPNKAFEAHAQSYRIGGAVFGQYAVTGNIVTRAETRLKVEREDLFVLRMHRTGFTRGIMGDAGFRMQPDRFTLFDFHQNLNAETENVDYVSVTLPYEAIGYDPTRHSPLLQLPSASPVGRVLRSNLELILELGPTADHQEALALSAGFSEFLNGILSRKLREVTSFQASARTREVAVRRFVSDNLRNHDLDSDLICQSIGASRPTLYRIFAEEGGVSRAITKLRLERTYEELALSVAERGAVARIAQAWCFTDPAHFSRLFRAAFKLAPSDVLGSALKTNQTDALRDRKQEIGKPASRTRLVDLYDFDSSKRTP